MNCFYKRELAGKWRLVKHPNEMNAINKEWEEAKAREYGREIYSF